MDIQAKLRYLRTSPRKVRLVADLIRGMSVVRAEQVLQFTIKRSASPILKLLKSAVANAENNFDLKKENLYISEICVDGGPIIKRFRPRARGSASPIQKKTSHITIKLRDISLRGKEEEKKAKKKEKTEIKKIYSKEKPKEEISREKKGVLGKEKTQTKEPTKEAKGEKKQIFRRKSI